MTKYILTGGKDRIPSSYGQALHDELTKTHKKFKLLSVFFSATQDHWEAMAKSWKEWFMTYVGDIESYDYARIDTFVQQIKDHDVIYLHGGHTKLLREVMRSFGDLRELFEGKVVVGSSAGANMLAKNFWSSSQQKPFKGLSVLDINVMVHYGAVEHEGIHRTPQDWEDEEKEFREFIGDDSKIWRLPERELTVLEVED